MRLFIVSREASQYTYFKELVKELMSFLEEQIENNDSKFSAVSTQDDLELWKVNFINSKFLMTASILAVHRLWVQMSQTF